MDGKELLVNAIRDALKVFECASTTYSDDQLNKLRYRETSFQDSDSFLVKKIEVIRARAFQVAELSMAVCLQASNGNGRLTISPYILGPLLRALLDQCSYSLWIMGKAGSKIDLDQRWAKYCFTELTFSQSLNETFDKAYPGQSGFNHSAEADQAAIEADFGDAGVSWPKSGVSESRVIKDVFGDNSKEFHAWKFLSNVSHFSYLEFLRGKLELTPGIAHSTAAMALAMVTVAGAVQRHNERLFQIFDGLQ